MIPIYRYIVLLLNTESLQLLYDLLIEPISDLLPVPSTDGPAPQIVFLPCGSLYLVPFSALHKAEQPALVEQYVIAYAHSIQGLGMAGEIESITADAQKLLVGDVVREYLYN